MDSITRIREDSNLNLRIRVRSGPRIRANSGRIRIRANSCEFKPASLWWATYTGSEAAEIAEYFTTTSSAMSSDDSGPETSPLEWYDHAPNEFQQGIDFYQAQQQGHKEFDMWDSSTEGSCRQTTTSRRKDRRLLTAKELEILDKEIEMFFKDYQSAIGSESG